MTLLKPFFAAAVLAAGLGLPGAASASTAVSGVICEGGVAPSISLSDCGRVMRDFGRDASKVVLSPGADGVHLYGGVANGAGATKWTDAFTFDFGANIFAISFTWAPKGAGTNFDGILDIGDRDNVAFSTADTPAGETILLGTFTGKVAFVVDPIAGSFAPKERGTWDMQVTAVPLPAGLSLLGMGLCALGLTRRRTTV